MRSKKIKFFVIILLSLYLIAHVVLYVVQADFLFIPSRRMKDTLTYSKRYGLGEIEDFYITTPTDTKLHVWYQKPKKSNKLVLWLHGQSGHLGHTSKALKELLSHNYGFFAIDYRGYGKSDNIPPTEEGIYEDVDTALKYIKDELGYNLKKEVILIGESLGGAPATYLAAKNDFHGVMLIAPFTSTRDVAIERYWYLHFIYLLLKNLFSNIYRIGEISSPLLIIHGTDDKVVPHTHSKNLIAKANHPKRLLLYPGKRHSDHDYHELFSKMKRFFKNTRGN